MHWTTHWCLDHTLLFKPCTALVFGLHTYVIIDSWQSLLLRWVYKPSLIVSLSYVLGWPRPLYYSRSHESASTGKLSISLQCYKTLGCNAVKMQNLLLQLYCVHYTINRSALCPLHHQQTCSVNQTWCSIYTRSEASLILCSIDRRCHTLSFCLHCSDRRR